MILSPLPVGTARLYRLCLHLAVGASIWGYNIGILASILVHPGWRSAMRDPDPSARGTITAVYYLGTLLAYLFVSHPLADWLGRRYAALYGTLALAFGAVVMASSQSLTVMAAGRFCCGLGVGVVSTTVPLYQRYHSEISPAQERGKFVTINHVGFIAGLASGLWVGYGMSFWTEPSGIAWGWRISILIQLLPAAIFAAGLPFCPDTPRWLVEKGHTERARRVLIWLRQDAVPPDAITQELHAITLDVDSHPRFKRSSLSLSLSLFREPPLRARLWRAFLLQFLAQMCGAAVMKYYLPSLLRALGLDTQLALMAGAIEMTIKIGMTIIEMWIIDRIGRRACLVGGSLIMGVAMLINGALPIAYPKNVNKGADVVCIIFIFVYAMGYSLGLGPAAWVYSSEIFPTSVRARGLNFAASGGSIGSILVSKIWPLGLAHWGSGIYFFFMVVNFACAPIVWLFYPETKGRALEDMDEIFGGVAPRTAMLNNEELNGDAQDSESELQSPVLGRSQEHYEQARLLS
ncbi:unnamed protein product [Clonostachys solani]|uniref:Major facilitator superfamily (MFS) profile domain-containing protein n=1 Tax=Clonostachys solani TaxID=160281 RepID=A0A9N9ZGM2_9HYPO|nr:unnamed protein product [Clonostachys solani]